MGNISVNDWLWMPSYYKAVYVDLRAGRRRLRFVSIEPRALLRALDRELAPNVPRTGKGWATYGDKAASATGDADAAG